MAWWNNLKADNWCIQCPIKFDNFNEVTFSHRRVTQSQKVRGPVEAMIYAEIVLIKHQKRGSVCVCEGVSSGELFTHTPHLCSAWVSVAVPPPPPPPGDL